MGSHNSSPADIQVIILAGGRGSRSENPTIPKPLQKIWSGKTVLELQLDALAEAGFRDVCLLVGYLAEQMMNYLGEILHRYPTLSIGHLFDEQDDWGTAQSVSAAVRRLGSRKDFLLLLGDTVIAAPLGHYFRRWEDSKADLGVLCHPNLHLDDSDTLLLDQKCEIIDFREKGEKGVATESTPGFLVQAATGVLFFTSKMAIGIVGSNGDVTKELIKNSLLDNSGVGIIATHYFKDSGTSGRLDAIRTDFADGSAARRGGINRAALLIDRDNTLIADGGTSRATLAEGEICVGLPRALQEFNKHGLPVFVVTNQPGIAKGQITESDVFRVHNELGDHLSNHGALIDGLYFCPHHPEIGFEGEVVSLKIPCLCRKPGTGMLVALAEEHGIDLSKSVLIGDSESDAEAAAESDCRFKSASWNGSTATLTSKVMLETLQEIIHDSN
jgi:mannose-1-phosphate guanylyltransferase / phosphomannomutase